MREKALHYADIWCILQEKKWWICFLPARYPPHVLRLITEGFPFFCEQRFTSIVQQTDPCLIWTTLGHGSYYRSFFLPSVRPSLWDCTWHAVTCLLARFKNNLAPVGALSFFLIYMWISHKASKCETDTVGDVEISMTWRSLWKEAHTLVVMSECILFICPVGNFIPRPLATNNNNKIIFLDQTMRYKWLKYP